MALRKNPIIDCYAGSVEYEWKRLVQDAYHRLEFDTTMHFASKYLPKKGLLLDAGGGPGRYTVEFARKGYNVDLIDLTPENVEFAKDKIRRYRLKSKVGRIQVGDITDLSFIEDSTYDAVLCLGGPISHIEGEENRDRALKELARVAKHSSPIILNVFGRVGALLLSVQFWPNEIRLSNFDDFYKNGEDHLWHGKYYAHFFLPEEIEAMVSRNGLELVQMVGLEGIGANAKYVSMFAKKDKAGWSNFLSAHEHFASHPSAIGMSVHILAICRKS